MDPINDLATRTSFASAFARSAGTVLVIGWFMAWIAQCEYTEESMHSREYDQPWNGQSAVEPEDDCALILKQHLAKLSSFPIYRLYWRAHLLNAQSKPSSADVAGQESRSSRGHWLWLGLVADSEAGHPVSLKARLTRQNGQTYLRPFGQERVYSVDEYLLPGGMTSATLADPFGISGLDAAGSFGEALLALSNRYEFKTCNKTERPLSETPLWTFDGAATLPERVDTFFRTPSIRLANLVWHCGAVIVTKECTFALEAARREIVGRAHVTLSLALQRPYVSWMLTGEEGPWARVETRAFSDSSVGLSDGFQQFSDVRSVKDLIKKTGPGRSMHRMQTMFRVLGDAQRVGRARRALEEVLR